MFRELLATATLALSVSAADAATMQALYTGTIVGGYDQSGLFTTPGGNLDNLSFSMAFVYDTSVGRMIMPQFDEVIGGKNLRTKSPMISASVTVNGQTMKIRGKALGYALLYGGAQSSTGEDVFNVYASDRATDAVTGSGYTYDIGAQIIDDSFGIPYNLDAPFSLSGLAGANGNALYFFFQRYDGVLGAYTMRTSGTLVADTLTVSQFVAAPVPLPASALMLLAAVAGLGGLQASRRKRAV